ncbi:MAG: hypothetical protein M1825_001757 [Sarcosagium campestre]|nr:MAG: hypothetical protein M1825_001757 [Sarcosagium campestre]
MASRGSDAAGDANVTVGPPVPPRNDAFAPGLPGKTGDAETFSIRSSRSQRLGVPHKEPSHQNRHRRRTTRHRTSLSLNEISHLAGQEQQRHDRHQMSSLNIPLPIPSRQESRRLAVVTGRTFQDVPHRAVPRRGLAPYHAARSLSSSDMPSNLSLQGVISQPPSAYAVKAQYAGFRSVSPSPSFRSRMASNPQTYMHGGIEHRVSLQRPASSSSTVAKTHGLYHRGRSPVQEEIYSGLDQDTSSAKEALSTVQNENDTSTPKAVKEMPSGPSVPPSPAYYDYTEAFDTTNESRLAGELSVSQSINRRNTSMRRGENHGESNRFRRGRNGPWPQPIQIKVGKEDLAESGPVRRQVEKASINIGLDSRGSNRQLTTQVPRIKALDGSQKRCTPYSESNETEQTSLLEHSTCSFPGAVAAKGAKGLRESDRVKSKDKLSSFPQSLSHQHPPTLTRNLRKTSSLSSLDALGTGHSFELKSILPSSVLPLPSLSLPSESKSVAYLKVNQSSEESVSENSVGSHKSDNFQSGNTPAEETLIAFRPPEASLESLQTPTSVKQSAPQVFLDRASAQDLQSIGSDSKPPLQPGLQLDDEIVSARITEDVPGKASITHTVDTPVRSQDLTAESSTPSPSAPSRAASTSSECVLAKASFPWLTDGVLLDPETEVSRPSSSSSQRGPSVETAADPATGMAQRATMDKAVPSALRDAFDQSPSAEEFYDSFYEPGPSTGRGGVASRTGVEQADFTCEDAGATELEPLLPKPGPMTPKRKRTSIRVYSASSRDSSKRGLESSPVESPLRGSRGADRPKGSLEDWDSLKRAINWEGSMLATDSRSSLIDDAVPRLYMSPREQESKVLDSPSPRAQSGKVKEAPSMARGTNLGPSGRDYSKKMEEWGVASSSKEYSKKIDPDDVPASPRDFSKKKLDAIKAEGNQRRVEAGNDGGVKNTTYELRRTPTKIRRPQGGSLSSRADNLEQPDATSGASVPLEPRRPPPPIPGGRENIVPRVPPIPGVPVSTVSPPKTVPQPGYVVPENPLKLRPVGAKFNAPASQEMRDRIMRRHAMSKDPEAAIMFGGEGSKVNLRNPCPTDFGQEPSSAFSDDSSDEGTASSVRQKISSLKAKLPGSKSSADLSPEPMSLAQLITRPSPLPSNESKEALCGSNAGTSTPSAVSVRSESHSSVKKPSGKFKSWLDKGKSKAWSRRLAGRKSDAGPSGKDKQSAGLYPGV